MKFAVKINVHHKFGFEYFKKSTMKKIFLFLFCLIVSTFGFANRVIVLDGVYQGKNIYVQNPFAASGVGFCVQEV